MVLTYDQVPAVLCPTTDLLFLTSLGSVGKWYIKLTLLPPATASVASHSNRANRGPTGSTSVNAAKFAASTTLIVILSVTCVGLPITSTSANPIPVPIGKFTVVFGATDMVSEPLGNNKI